MESQINSPHGIACSRQGQGQGQGQGNIPMNVSTTQYISGANSGPLMNPSPPAPNYGSPMGNMSYIPLHQYQEAVQVSGPSFAIPAPNNPNVTIPSTTINTPGATYLQVPVPSQGPQYITNPYVYTTPATSNTNVICHPTLHLPTHAQQQESIGYQYSPVRVAGNSIHAPIPETETTTSHSQQPMSTQHSAVHTSRHHEALQRQDTTRTPPSTGFTATNVFPSPVYQPSPPMMFPGSTGLHSIPMKTHCQSTPSIPNMSTTGGYPPFHHAQVQSPCMSPCMTPFNQLPQIDSRQQLISYTSSHLPTPPVIAYSVPTTCMATSNNGIPSSPHIQIPPPSVQIQEQSHAREMPLGSIIVIPQQVVEQDNDATHNPSFSPNASDDNIQIPSNSSNSSMIHTSTLALTSSTRASRKKRLCSFPECPCQARVGRLCIRHGGGKRCVVANCNSLARLKGGVCKAHRKQEIDGVDLKKVKKRFQLLPEKAKVIQETCGVDYETALLGITSEEMCIGEEGRRKKKVKREKK